MRTLKIIKYTLHFSILALLFNTYLIGGSLEIKKDSFSPSNIPTFESYPVIEDYKGKIAPVDLNSYPEACLYRTMLRNGVKSGPNFAGHYVVIPIGCGTDCQNQWVVNIKTGKVLARLLTTIGAKYRLDSKLLILNAPTEEYKRIYKENPRTAYLPEKTVYVILENDMIKVIYQEDLENLLKVPHVPLDK